jgi:hypothetical protein
MQRGNKVSELYRSNFKEPQKKKLFLMCDVAPVYSSLWLP